MQLPSCWSMVIYLTTHLELIKTLGNARNLGMRLQIHRKSLHCGLPQRRQRVDFIPINFTNSQDLWSIGISDSIWQHTWKDRLLNENETMMLCGVFSHAFSLPISASEVNKLALTSSDFGCYLTLTNRNERKFAIFWTRRIMDKR